MDGCPLIRAPLLHPAGPVALAERDLLFTAVFIMLVVIVPVFAMTFLFAWRYRRRGGYPARIVHHCRHHREHFDQIFSSHGTIMVFFMAMPFLTGLINIIVPQQIGTRRA